MAQYDHEEKVLGDLEVTVVDETGAPVAGATVEAFEEESSKHPYRMEVRTSETGVARLRGLPVGELIPIVVRKLGYDRVRTSPTVYEGRVTARVVALNRIG